MNNAKDSDKTRELTEAELNHVSGGSLNYGHVEHASTSQTDASPPAKPNVWVGCAWVPQWW